MRIYAKLAFATAFSLVLAGGSFVAGLYLGESRVPVVERVAGLLNKEGDVLSERVDAVPFDFGPYWRVWNILDRKFIPFSTSTENVAVADRVYRSIEGLVASYNDPYTEFMRPQRSEDFKMITRGSLEGIGAVIGEHEGKLLVVAPLPGSPAEKAGLLPGDYISAINGEPSDPLTVDEAVSRIRGEGGTTVVLTVIREGEEAAEISVTRGTIEIPSTSHAVIEREVPVLAVADTNDASDSEGPPSSPPTASDEPKPEKPVETEVRDFYILRLFSFSQTSVNAFERELNDFITSGSDSLIIDLRGNPGGYLEVAVQMAGWFLPKGTVVVREFQGPEMKELVHRTQNGTKFHDHMPHVVVLVDKGSASASEILAGALREHGIATLVGTNTFGKGSVQELIDITDELALKVTVARWYTPNGVSISNGGLTPDVVVDPTTATSGDPWIEAAIDFLSTQSTKTESV